MALICRMVNLNMVPSKSALSRISMSHQERHTQGEMREGRGGEGRGKKREKGRELRAVISSGYQEQTPSRPDKTWQKSQS